VINVRRSHHEGQTPLVVVSLSDCLTQLEHQVFLPILESEMRLHNDLRLLFELDDGLHWEPRSRWRSLRFAAHPTLVHKLAIVGGEPSWQKWIWTACQPLTVRQALLFSSEQKPSALAWTWS
jgi:hypothetical protein